jgi:hypothetical protein
MDARPNDGTTCLQIDAAAAKLAGARAGEHEASPLSRFDQEMHDAEKFGHALHLVDDHPLAAGGAGDDVAQPLGGARPTRARHRVAADR